MTKCPHSQALLDRPVPQWSHNWWCLEKRKYFWIYLDIPCGRSRLWIRIRYERIMLCYVCDLWDIQHHKANPIQSNIKSKNATSPFSVPSLNVHMPVMWPDDTWWHTDTDLSTRGLETDWRLERTELWTLGRGSLQTRRPHHCPETRDQDPILHNIQTIQLVIWKGFLKFLKKILKDCHEHSVTSWWFLSGGPKIM